MLWVETGRCTIATPGVEVLCSESVTSPSSLLRPHVPVRGPLTGCAFGSFGESSQLRPPAAGPPDLPDVISKYIHWMLGPIHRWFDWCIYPLLPNTTAAFPLGYRRVGFPRVPTQRLQCGVRFRCGSHSLLFKPPALLAMLIAPTRFNGNRSGHGVYVRAEHESLPPRASDMLVARIRAIGDMKTYTSFVLSLVGCSYPGAHMSMKFSAFPYGKAGRRRFPVVHHNFIAFHAGYPAQIRTSGITAYGSSIRW